MNGTYTGVVDRVVDGETVVILLEEDGEVVEELNVSVEQLPGEAKERAVLNVTVDNGQFVEAEFLHDETEERMQSARKRLDRLSTQLSEKDNKG